MKINLWSSLLCFFNGFFGKSHSIECWWSLPDGIVNLINSLGPILNDVTLGWTFINNFTCKGWVMRLLRGKMLTKGIQKGLSHKQLRPNSIRRIFLSLDISFHDITPRRPWQFQLIYFHWDEPFLLVYPQFTSNCDVRKLFLRHVCLGPVFEWLFWGFSRPPLRTEESQSASLSDGASTGFIRWPHFPTLNYAMRQESCDDSDSFLIRMGNNENTLRRKGWMRNLSALRSKEINSKCVETFGLRRRWLFFFFRWLVCVKIWQRCNRRRYGK